MKANKLPTLCAIFFLSAAIPAETIPGRWELVESLKFGTQINVRTFAGIVHSGSIQKLGAEHLLLLDESGWQLWIPKSDIQVITRIKEGTKERYTGIGAILGFISGMTAGMVAGDSGIFDDVTAAGSGMFLGGIGAGAGALIGYATVKADSEIIYTAPKDTKATDVQTSSRF